jgi:hypothetical protein
VEDETAHKRPAFHETLHAPPERCVQDSPIRYFV